MPRVIETDGLTRTFGGRVAVDHLDLRVEPGTVFGLLGPIVFMSNAFVPLSAMPPWMALLARLNPLTYAIEAIRLLVLDGWSVGVARSLGVLALFAAACLAIGTAEFRRHTGQRALRTL
jgi:ABC-2 type transport system permease protein